jgi:protein-L-isoaspartate(D-aspartate) O-methyltransferase
MPQDQREAQIMNMAMTMTSGAAAETPTVLRERMVKTQLQTVGVTDPVVLDAMGEVAREDWVPAHLQGLAYADAALEVAPGRFLLSPMTLALLLQHAGLTAGQKVLVVGAATGLSAAVVQAAGARAVALDCDPALVALAAAAGLEAVQGPLAEGWAAGAPYDIILFEGAIETVPTAIVDQLAPGGRVAAVMRDGRVGRAMAGPLLAGRIATPPFLEVAARPLPGLERPRSFNF